VELDYSFNVLPFTLKDFVASLLNYGEV